MPVRPAGGLAQLPPRLEFKKPPTREKGKEEGRKSMRFRCRYAYPSILAPVETWPNLDDDVTPRQKE